MAALAQNGQGLKDGYSQLNGGLSALFAQITPAMPPEMAAQITALQGQLTAYQQGLDGYIDGVSSMASGMNAFADGLSQLGDAGSGLVSGLSSIINGMSQITDGLSKTAGEMNQLPEAVQKLIDGQSELKDGVDTAATTFDEWNLGSSSETKPVSFVSAKNAPRSVQFIFKTASIAKAAQPKVDEQTQAKKSFFEKLAELFQ
jgi:uncharacterized phage infection (PIP) family protein YhgE